jgi:hypothetical protein
MPPSDSALPLLHLCRFETYYGQPIAKILSLDWGKDIEFHVNSPSSSTMGFPDFAFFERVGPPLTELVVGEGKVSRELYASLRLLPCCSEWHSSEKQSNDLVDGV